jgi:hypothetical protein
VHGRLPGLRALSARAAGKAIAAAGAVGRIGVLISNRARSYPKVCTGIVSLAILVASLLFLWPRQWPDDLVPRFSGAERLSRDAPAPGDRKPAEPAAAAPLAKAAPPRPGAAALPARQAEIPAPVRRSNPALARSRTTASTAQPSTEAIQNAEASDPTAAIDWLVKGGSSRRHAERP